MSSGRGKKVKFTNGCERSKRVLRSSPEKENPIIKALPPQAINSCYQNNSGSLVSEEKLDPTRTLNSSLAQSWLSQECQIKYSFDILKLHAHCPLEKQMLSLQLRASLLPMFSILFQESSNSLFGCCWPVKELAQISVATLLFFILRDELWKNFPLIEAAPHLYRKNARKSFLN